MAGEITLKIEGNLTNDPTLTITPSGIAVVKFTVAATTRRYDQQAQGWKDTDSTFVECEAWRDLAEHIADSLLEKGTRVMVSGRLTTQRWETPEGDKRSRMVLQVDDLGPSLKGAVVRVRKASRGGEGQPAQQQQEQRPAQDRARYRTGGGQQQSDDPWATGSGGTGSWGRREQQDARS